MLRGILSSVAALFLFSCTTTTFMSPTIRENTELSSIQNSLVEAGHWAKGKSRLSVNGKTFNMDCSGVISAIYWNAGIDLQSYYPRYTGNGVSRIYQLMEDEDLLYRPDAPAPGDIIFWDNSYDMNNNGLADDELTHIGMVVSVSLEGDVSYVHDDYIKGVIFARMYPPDSSDKTRNSGMRIASLKPAPGGKTTSGDLYRAAGRAYELDRK